MKHKENFCRDCGISIHWDVQNTTGWHPVQPVLSDPTLSREIGLADLERIFPTLIAVWFYDSTEQNLVQEKNE